MYVPKFVIGDGGRFKRNYIPESSSLLSCVIATVLDDFPNICLDYSCKEEFVLFLFFSGFGCFSRKNTNFVILKSLFGSTSRDSTKVLPKKVQRPWGGL